MGKIVNKYADAGGGEHFEIEYGPPFAGIDSSALPPYIAPNAVLTMNNFLILDEQIVGNSFNLVNTFTGNHARIGVGDLNGLIFAVDYDTGSNTVAVYTYSPNPLLGTASTETLIGSFNPATPPQLGILSYININGVCYFSWSGSDTIYQHNGTIATVLTSFLGGAYLAELNGRLIVGNVWQTVATVLTNFPYQFAWSAPGGAYNQFNPLVGGLVTGAGFNNLPDVEDVISGLVTQGPTAYVFRTAGITEVTPLNSGIQPFDFNHLWASHKGIGTPFGQSVAQYGSFAAFIAEDDIYTIGYDGINVIAGKAKTFLYKQLKVPFNVVKCILTPLQIDGNVSLYYVVMIVVESVNMISTFFFFYNFMKKEWSQLLYNTNKGLNFAQPILASVTAANNTLYGNPAIAYVISNNGITEYHTIKANSSLPFTNAGQNSIQLIFPQEEAMFGRDVTIDGILLYLSGTSSLVLNLSINGVTFGFNGVPIVMSGTNFTYYFAYPINGLAFTGKLPQLTLTVNSTIANQQFKIGKISLFCTVDPKQRIV